ncbi:uncharacterized protein K452DRAFT_223554 [Aplosporella prunicola CBS 121167]|uniref:Mitotic checkpoint regulator, MAD2B-interacting-domain-containing protein n=1 Tax=Aplosporella prunicola CBS 121167 TaxID=1176127 RepID=A0A6A6BJ97_9PEZI|nr:uncharacterized protein K452DRAFT_223554 [Aplosporella prunicola CBS 121167]KAF2144219.1 hypothetical protein K452DRAFT_223554 [Aplosporella prunicola CBS 121167]
MNLVQYSDSEGSDAEAPPPPPAAPKQNKNFQKVNPHKIRVNLPAPTDDAATDAPPAKKARTGGGAFSGFNAFLPAPKRSADDAAKKERGTGLGKGVNLKTGAAPGFSRDVVAETGHEQQAELSRAPEQAPQQQQQQPKEEVKLVGKTTRFMPLSVANKAKKKKKTPAAVLMANKGAAASPAPTPAASAAGAPAPAPPKPKVSLFSLSTEDAVPAASTSGGDYKPMLYTSTQQTRTDQASDDTATPYQNHSSSSGPQSLDAVAADLNLSKADKRQLFGRQRGNQSSSGAGMSAINIVNFNTDEEYAANEALRASGETVQHNPLKSIAPGKHSLKQLVNAAATQKDALEEHFATGKRNKKEAGSKYGW